jgi:hypothetical protein
MLRKRETTTRLLLMDMGEDGQGGVELSGWALRGGLASPKGNGFQVVVKT